MKIIKLALLAAVMAPVLSACDHARNHNNISQQDMANVRTEASRAHAVEPQIESHVKARDSSVVFHP